jgi:glycosyltransferase involved in cell wall biosynthesis
VSRVGKGHALRNAARRLWPHRDRLLLVVDDAGWILDEVGGSLQRHLPAALRARTVGSDWPSARGCTIHFIHRAWAWNDAVLDRVHPSNRLLGLWWHGRPDSPDPRLVEALNRLRRVQSRFARIQVTGTIGRATLLNIGVPADKIVMLPEGVDLALFRPAADASTRDRARRALGIADGALAIGCFQKDGDGWGDGAIPKLVKGPDVLADALIALATAQRLHAVLPGPSRGYLTRRLTAAGVPFSAPGFVPRAALPGLYHALDLYVSPSRDEGGPAGVLEAMASGVPVVSTETGMAVDLIEHGDNGSLVSVGRSDELAAAIGALADAPDDRRRYADRSLHTIAAYDWPLVAQQYAQDLYFP